MCFGLFNYDEVKNLLNQPDVKHEKEAACACTNDQQFNPFGGITISG